MQLQSFRAVLVTILLLAPAAAVSAQTADFDLQTFKTPPAQFRGHAMGNINLTTSTPQTLIDEVEEMKKLNYGEFFLEAGGSSGLGLSDAYLKQFGCGRLSSAKGNFFANSSPDVDTKIILRGHKTLNIWNPHSGEQEPAELTPGDANGQPITTLHLKLASVSSLFFVGE